MECLTIFFSVLSMIPSRYHWEKRKLNKRQGFTDCKGFENGVPDHIFLSSFHDSCTRYHGGKMKLNMRQGFTDCEGFENGVPDHIFLSSFRFLALRSIGRGFHWMNGCCDCNMALFLPKNIFGKIVYVCQFCPLKALWELLRIYKG